MSKASDDLLVSLRSAVARAASEQVDRTLILTLAELGYETTFDSPIEHLMFLGLCVEATGRSRFVRFIPGRAPGVTRALSLRMERPDGPVMSTFESVGRRDTRDEMEEFEGFLIGAAGGRDQIVRVFSQVEYRDYRLDLLVVDAFGMRVAIECDGHDFHERTKAQARHDRRRDRTLTRDGLCFLRFTGSELFANTLGCAREVFDVLDEELTREMGR